MRRSLGPCQYPGPPPLTGAWRRGQQGWPSRFVLVQFPNAPLLIYVAAETATRIATGWVHDIAWALSRVALIIWAYEEAARGVNWFRRGIGTVVLVAITVALARRVG
jgi:hypothetical protein